MAVETIEPSSAPVLTDNIFKDVKQFFDRSFWTSLAPKFTISDDQDASFFKLSREEKDSNKARVFIEGYTHLKNPGLKADFAAMADLFVKLDSMGLPPAFAFVFDEFWKLSTQLDDFVRGVLDEKYAMLPDFWAWIIKPGASGFIPHRDKGPDSLFPDKRPKSITIWLPITEAHPLNGCMYILPANRDKMYGVGPQFGGILPDIRALPGMPGDVFSWTQHAFHWGSHAADSHDLPPRMSVAFEFQRTDVPAFNLPLLTPGTIPPFNKRLALIGKQALQYRHLYKPSPELLDAARALFASYPVL